MSVSLDFRSHFGSSRSFALGLATSIVAVLFVVRMMAASASSAASETALVPIKRESSLVLATPTKPPNPTSGSLSTCSQSELSGLAKRIPATVKRTGTDEQQRRRTLCRKCLIQCVDFLVKSEDKAPDVWLLIQNNMLPSEMFDQGGECFLRAPKCLKKVPTPFKAQWLSSRSDGTLSMGDVQFIDSVDENWLDDALALLLKMTMQENLHPSLQNKAVLCEFLDIRFASVQCESIADWVLRCLDRKTMSFDWWLGGAYRVKFENHRAVKFTHRSGESVAVPDYVHLFDDFKLINPVSEAQATLTKGIVSQKLLDLFPDESEARKGLLDKKGAMMKSLVDEAASNIEAKRTASLRQAAGAEGFVDHTKHKRQEALAKAKASRPAGSEIVAKRRRSLACLVDDQKTPNVD